MLYSVSSEARNLVRRIRTQPAVGWTVDEKGPTRSPTICPQGLEFLEMSHALEKRKCNAISLPQKEMSMTLSKRSIQAASTIWPLINDLLGESKSVALIPTVRSFQMTLPVTKLANFLVNVASSFCPFKS